jgi:hypothetical protein
MSVGGVSSGEALAHPLAEEIMGNSLSMKKSSIDGKIYLDYLWERTSSWTTFRWCWGCMGASWQWFVHHLYLVNYQGRCGGHASRAQGGGERGHLAPTQYVRGNQRIPYIPAGVQNHQPPRLQYTNIIKI